MTVTTRKPNGQGLRTFLMTGFFAAVTVVVGGAGWMVKDTASQQKAFADELTDFKVRRAVIETSASHQRTTLDRLVVKVEALDKKVDQVLARLEP